MNILRPALPKTRRWKLTENLSHTLVGTFSKYTKKFKVWKGHSRWAWWKFYRDNK